MRMLKDRRGSELTEIGITLALIVIVAIVAIRLLGDSIREVLTNVARAIRGG